MDVKYFSKKLGRKPTYEEVGFLSLFKRNDIWLYLLLMVDLKKFQGYKLWDVSSDKMAELVKFIIRSKMKYKIIKSDSDGWSFNDDVELIRNFGLDDDDTF